MCTTRIKERLQNSADKAKQGIANGMYFSLFNVSTALAGLAWFYREEMTPEEKTSLVYTLAYMVLNGYKFNLAQSIFISAAYILPEIYGDTVVEIAKNAAKGTAKATMVSALSKASHLPLILGAVSGVFGFFSKPNKDDSDSEHVEDKSLSLVSRK